MGIRPAEIGDLQAVYAMLCALEDCVLPEAAFDEIFAQNMAQPVIRYLVAEENGIVHGFVSLHMDRPLHHAALVGGSLLRAAQWEAKAAGRTHLELSSGMARTRAHGFYERGGWVKDHFHFTYAKL